MAFLEGPLSQVLKLGPGAEALIAILIGMGFGFTLALVLFLAVFIQYR